MENSQYQIPREVNLAALMNLTPVILLPLAIPRKELRP